MPAPPLQSALRLFPHEFLYEIIRDGSTGVLCADEEEMVRAVPRAMALDPAACRAHAAELFDRNRIARQYLEIYEQVLGSAKDEAPKKTSAPLDTPANGSPLPEIGPDQAALVEAYDEVAG